MKRFFILAIPLLLLCSCNSYRNIDVKAVDFVKVDILSTSKALVEMEYEINNTARSPLVVVSADGFLSKEDVDFAQISLYKADTIPASMLSKGRITFQVDILDPLSLLSMGFNMKNWDLSDFRINGALVVKNSSGMRHKMKFKDMPVNELIRRY